MNPVAEPRAKAPSPTGSNGAANGHATEGRESNGRFSVGNKLARGNPHARRVAALRKAFLDAATEARMRRVALKLLTMAEAGDVAAARLALEYTLGKPAKAADIDRLDLDEVALLSAAPLVADMPATGRVAPGLLAEMLRLSQADSHDEYRELLILRMEELRLKLREARDAGGFDIPPDDADDDEDESES
jgi:hypothetical protein